MRRLAFPLLAALTLGLAPFVPEPHLVGKVRWVAGGAEGMGPVDYFDLALHGAPWLWLLFAVVYESRVPEAERAPLWMRVALALALAFAALCVAVAVAG